MASPDRGVLQGQANEIADIAGHDSAALRPRCRPQDSVSRALKVRALEHCHDIVPLATQLDRDPGGEMLVEQQLHARR